MNAQLLPVICVYASKRPGTGAQVCLHSAPRSRDQEFHQLPSGSGMDSAATPWRCSMMTKKFFAVRSALLTAALAATLCGLPYVSVAAAKDAGDAASRLDKKQFHDVKVTVDNGIATLSGTVDLYAYKAEAEKRVRKANGVSSVRNLIDVAGP